MQVRCQTAVVARDVVEHRPTPGLATEIPPVSQTVLTGPDTKLLKNAMNALRTTYSTNNHVTLFGRDKATSAELSFDGTRRPDILSAPLKTAKTIATDLTGNQDSGKPNGLGVAEDVARVPVSLDLLQPWVMGLVVQL